MNARSSAAPRTLRRLLLRGLLPPLLLLTVLWTWATHRIVVHFANVAFDHALEDTARTLAGQVMPGGVSAAIDLPPAAQRMLAFDEVDTVLFSVSDGDGRLWVGERVLPAAPMQRQDDASIYDARVGDAPLRLAEFVVRGDDGAALYVRVAETLHKREAMARAVTATLLVTQAVFLAVLVALVWLGVGRGIAPFRQLSRDIARRTADDLSPIDESDLPHEVREQVGVINALMRQLERSLDARRDFIALAAHQLRTPIAVLRTQVELALRSDDAIVRQQVLSDMDAATARLVRLANQLLNLGRAESDAAVAREPLDVHALLEDAVAAHVPQALSRGIDLRLDLPPGRFIVSGDGVLLPEMLANAIDNAIRYTPRGGRVDVGASAAGDGIVLSVGDSGPGIAAAERDRLTERFTRGRTEGVDGSGLGLAIAREIAAAHGGDLRLTGCPRLGGLRVELRLPLAHGAG